MDLFLEKFTKTRRNWSLLSNQIHIHGTFGTLNNSKSQKQKEIVYQFYHKKQFFQSFQFHIISKIFYLKIDIYGN